MKYQRLYENNNKTKVIEKKYTLHYVNLMGNTSNLTKSFILLD